MCKTSFEYIRKQLCKHAKDYKEVQEAVADILTKHPEDAKQNISIMKSIAEVETKRSTLIIERSSMFFVVFVAFIAFLLALAQFVNPVHQMNNSYQMNNNILSLRCVIIFSATALVILFVYYICEICRAQKKLVYYEILKDYCQSGELLVNRDEPCGVVCKYCKHHCHNRTGKNRVKKNRISKCRTYRTKRCLKSTTLTTL